MTDRLLVTHVGSLVRPPDLVTFLRRQHDDEPYDVGAYERCLRDSVADVVRRQAEAGIDIVSDGEFGKSLSWSRYVVQRLTGVQQRVEGALPNGPVVWPGTDGRLFPEFWSQYAVSQGIDPADMRGWTCVAPIAYGGGDAIRRDIANLKSALDEVDVVGAFMPCVAPASIALAWEEVYASEEEYLHAVAAALREEYRAVLDAGLLLQVDDAYLPWMYDLMVPPATPDDHRRWAQLRVDALNHALEGLPRERVRYHICWGSFNAPHVGDVPAREIIDLVLQVNAGAYLIEMANPRHEHEWRLWEDVELPEGTTLVPGVISHSTNVVEHPELVAERLTRLARLVGAERLIAGTDCGFAQGPFVQRVHPSIQWAKLQALSEGARLASSELRMTGRRAARV